MKGFLGTVQNRLRVQKLKAAGDLQDQWNRADVLALPEHFHKRYLVGFACSRRCVEMALRLRFEVFNLELQEGLEESFATGLDEDKFDEQMTHLVIIEKKTGRVVGTYRLQTMHQALARKGSYSAQEYDLSPLKPYFDRLLECGRACLAKDHRSFPTVMLLWTGISEFMQIFSQQYIFGCCSLTSTDPDDGWRAMRVLRKQSHLHFKFFLSPLETHLCGPSSREFDADLKGSIALPKLFSAYLRLGGKVISEPALDRAFGTVDFLVLVDRSQVNLASVGII